MRWSWKLGEVKGIAIRLHWTFLVVPVWVAIRYLATGAGIRAAGEATVFILAIFGCVVLHELGHAFTARRYGVRTRDITLLPIGGVAQMDRIPEDPKQELWIAVAGPAVNLAIAAVLLGLLNTFGDISQLLHVHVAGGAFLARLMWVNLVLAVFNMIPAFPMDGGRVLRALLARRSSYLRATHVAAIVGQAIAVCFGVLGFLGGNLILMFIALFVYIGAQAEAQQVEMRSLLKGVPVRDAMQTSFRTLHVDDVVQEAMEALIAGDQLEYPVLDDGHVAGILTRRAIMKSLAQQDTHRKVGEIMLRECPQVKETDPLDEVIIRMQQQPECGTFAVLREGGLVGILTPNKVATWMMLHSGDAPERDGSARLPQMQARAG